MRGIVLTLLLLASLFPAAAQETKTSSRAPAALEAHEAAVADATTVLQLARPTRQGRPQHVSGVTVSISPSPVTLHAAESAAFTAIVSNASVTGVTWRVNGIPGGNSSVGTVIVLSDHVGFYSAPASLSAPIDVLVTAVAQADGICSGSAMVKVLPNVSVSISPTSATLAVNASQQFNATVLNTGNTAVKWQVNYITGGSSAYGYISNTGLYTAPAQVPSPSQVVVTAVSLADETKSAAAFVTIQPAPTSVDINGNWQITATSSVVYGSAALVGNIVQNGSTLSGTVHITGSDCYTFETPVPFTGTLNQNLGSATMTTGSVSGQVISANFTVTPDGNVVNGSYSISGGCANGDHGSVTGYRIRSFTGTWKGTFTSSSGPTTSVTAVVTQYGPYTSGSYQGFYWLTGTLTFTSSPCYASGTIGFNLLAGAVTVMDINTSDFGVTSFSGYLTDLATQQVLTGTYTVKSGSCMGDTGSGNLVRQ